MAINIFEGGRRIGAVLIAIVTIAGIAIVWFSTTYVHAYFMVNGGGRPHVQVESCGQHDESRYVTKTSAAGREIGVSVCFKAYPDEKGEMMIPFKRANTEGEWWIGPKHHEEVMRYTASVAESLTLTPHEAEALDTLWWKERIKALLAGLGALALTIFGMLIAGKVIGWIIRGFLGIPQGQDTKPNSSAT